MKNVKDIKGDLNVKIIDAYTNRCELEWDWGDFDFQERISFRQDAILIG